MNTSLDPLNFRVDYVQRGVSSFNTEQPLHPVLRSYLYGQEQKDQIFHSLGKSIREQDVGPLCDAFLGLHLFMGGINSRTGFTSTHNDFSVLAPIVLFKGKQKFTCKYQNYPIYTAGPTTVRSDAACLPAESYETSFSVDMFGLKIVIEPEANLLCTPEARLEEYNRRKEQVEKSIYQTMQEQITHALANCPTLTMMRLRNDYPTVSKLFNLKENLRDFVYSEIQRESRDFCSWTLNAISPQGALQDAFSSLMTESKHGHKPDYIVTTPEVADFIANVDNYQTTATDVLYTVIFKDDKGIFQPGNIVPYEGVNKKVSLNTRAVTVNGTVLPILQVPHLNRESNNHYNMFEHNESFWVFNELGYNSGLHNATVGDFKPVVRTSIRVTDLHKGRDGKFTMSSCLKCGGGLLPETYDRNKYDMMLNMVPGLKRFIDEKTNETGLLEFIGKKLPMNSPYVYYFPSPKVRYHPQPNSRSNFRSTGIYGNRPSFDNWHPPAGDIEAAKDWLANKAHLNDHDLDDLESYLRTCAVQNWSEIDLHTMMQINEKYPTAKALGAADLDAASIQLLLNELTNSQGYSKFVGIPRYFEGIAKLAARQINRGRGPEDQESKTHLSKIVAAREALFRVARRLTSLFPRIDIPDGIITDCPTSIPSYDILDDPNIGGDMDRDTIATYKIYSHCIVPLLFSRLYTLEFNGEKDINFVNYTLPNPARKDGFRPDNETFRQPFFKYGFPTSSDISDIMTGHLGGSSNGARQITGIIDVTAYDPLFKYDVDVINDGAYSRYDNFFDHFVSHRFDYLRKTSDEKFAVRAMAALLNMTRYSPIIEEVIGHDTLMNRKYRIIRQCNMTVGMVGLYAGGKENMMYAVGNMSTVSKATANNGIDITTRVSGNCFIIDPISSGRVIHNAVSKSVNSGMTTTLIDVPKYVKSRTEHNLPDNWWKNAAFVVEALPGGHPLKDQHHFIPLNGRHLPQNYNSAGFDLCKIDVVGCHPGGWYTENPYATQGYSEAQLIYGELLERSKVPLYDKNSVTEGIQNIHQRATIDRKEVAGKVVSIVNDLPPMSSFSGRSNIGFLERQYIDGRDSYCNPHEKGGALSEDNDAWLSKSPLKENSSSETRFAEALRLNSKRFDAGVAVMESAYGTNNIRSQPLKTAVKGRFTTEHTK